MACERRFRASGRLRVRDRDRAMSFAHPRPARFDGKGGLGLDLGLEEAGPRFLSPYTNPLGGRVNLEFIILAFYNYMILRDKK